jgi:di/tricarboxylate transporter
MVTKTRARSARKPARRRARRRSPETGRVKWVRWLVAAVLGCLALLGGVLLLEGAGFFRDIERAENLVLVGWTAVAIVSIFLTLVLRMLRKK